MMKTIRRGRFIAPTADVSASIVYTCYTFRLAGGRFIAPTADVSAPGNATTYLMWPMMNFNEATTPSVGTDSSHPSPIMGFHKIYGIPEMERNLRRGRCIAPTADVSASGVNFDLSRFIS